MACVYRVQIQGVRQLGPEAAAFEKFEHGHGLSGSRDSIEVHDVSSLPGSQHHRPFPLHGFLPRAVLLKPWSPTGTRRQHPAPRLASPSRVTWIVTPKEYLANVRDTPHSWQLKHGRRRSRICFEGVEDLAVHASSTELAEKTCHESLLRSSGSSEAPDASELISEAVERTALALRVTEKDLLLSGKRDLSTKEAAPTRACSFRDPGTDPCQLR